MPINVTTVYTKERLIRFNDYIATSKKILWVLVALVTFYIVTEFFRAAVHGVLTPLKTMCFIWIVVMDLVYIFMSFVLPRIKINKSPTLGLVINYTFDVDTYTSKVSNVLIKEESTMDYSTIFKIVKNGEDLYLMVNRYRGVVVDLSQLTGEQKSLLKEAIQAKIEPKKFKWVD